MKLFTMKLTDEERSLLEQKANGVPLATYIKKVVLEGARETTNNLDDGSDGADLLMKIIGRFDSVDDFVERLIKYLGKSLPNDIEILLKNQSDHPLAGYKVVDFAPEYRGWTLYHPAKGQLVLSDDTNRTNLDSLYREDGVPLFKVGDIIL